MGIGMDELGFRIRLQLARYLAGELSFDAFESWFVPATWDTHTISDPNTRRLASWIRLRLAEFSSGHWTEADLQLLLGRLAIGTGTLGVPRLQLQSVLSEFVHPLGAEGPRVVLT
jgi:hypothetical protein